MGFSNRYKRINLAYRRMELHSHTHYSNIRLLDCINKPKDLVNRAIELGLAGICITDHETLAGHPELNIYQKEIQKKNPDFKIGLGNEIYLCESREKNQRYYHFILIAKNAAGHRALRELSSKAWMNSYFDRGLERVVILYSELEKMVRQYPNSLIACTACLGGELSTLTRILIESERAHDEQGRLAAHKKIVKFILWCKELFGEDFYIECAPGCSKEQIEVNMRLLSISHAFNVKMIVGTDAHYLKKEDRYVHKAYLNSKGGEREVDSFYEYAYLQSNEEIIENLKQSQFDESFVSKMFENSIEIYNKIENYSILHNQQIPDVEVIDYKKKKVNDLAKYPELDRMFQSDDKIERYWVNQCFDNFEKKFGDSIINHKEYIDELEEEAEVKKIVGDRLGTNMFRYPILLQHYIDLFWECGSTVGAGRGSACAALNHYLLGITQLNPIQYELPFFRYMNRDTVELGDVDLDLAPDKRPLILQRIRDERKHLFNQDLDEQAKDNLGCTLIATFGTESSKSAVLTACRGYRSEDCPNGIDVDIAQYLSSLIASERGFVWSLHDMFEGNQEKDRKPNQTFINEVEQYPGLKEIMLGIESLINKRSSHASGVIMFERDPYEHGCFMRTPSGEIITQYDLHMDEACGMTKLDLLVTEVQSKITQALLLLQKDGILQEGLTLRQLYDKYIHPDVLPLDNKKVWDAVQGAKVLDLFQFDTSVGSQGVKKVKPETIQELSATNGLIRLMPADKNSESPMDIYLKRKKNPDLIHYEMKNKYHLTIEEENAINKYVGSTYGIGISQEQFMRAVMDKDICGFSLKESNDARRIISKKKMDKIPELKEKIFERASSPAVARYVWDYIASTQLGYAFSDIHSLSYSFIGFQTAYLGVNWNPVYWNTACLIVNSGSLDDDGQTDYAKIAKALGKIINNGIKVSCIDINESEYTFKPDAIHNQILFGMKSLNKVGGDVVQQIIAHRPYKSINDFMNKCPLNKTVMISLIKSGAFDNLDNGLEFDGKEQRQLVMAYYIYKISEPKKKITLQNVSTLINKNLIPYSLEDSKQAFLFNKALKNKRKKENDGGYELNAAMQAEFAKFFDQDVLNVVDGQIILPQKQWDLIYKEKMDALRSWIKENQNEILQELNDYQFKETWDKYAQGNIAAWEMESMCFYYHDHELKNVNTTKYGLSDFSKLPIVPEVERFFKKKGKEIPIYKLTRIVGTVLGKNDVRSSISLLTSNGVAEVKFTKEYFANYDRQLSVIKEDGTKKIVDKSWFTRGVKLMITGFRRDDTFVAKSYANTPTHQLYKIVELTNDGKDMVIQHERNEE